MSTALRCAFQQRILVLDGGMGTMVQAADLGPDDFGGPELEGCNEHLVLTRPDVIQGIHEAYLKAGADIIETDTFGATPLVLAEYGLQDQTHAINVQAARLARAAADAHSSPDRPRFVAGSIGPTTKALTVTGGTTFQELQHGYHVQAKALIEGGCDLLIIETAQDTLNMKAACLGVAAAQAQAGTDLPTILSATIEPTGTMLAGQGIDAWHESIRHTAPIAVGMNCATGPAFMADHLRTLAELSPFYTSVYPNAGMPDVDGHYPETPESLAKSLQRFVDEGWVNLVGGCCGTTPDHIAAIARAVQGKAPRKPRTDRSFAVSGIERIVIDEGTRPLLVGERTNVIGSLRFKRLVESGEWEKAAEVGRAQVKKGAHIVDVCLSHTERVETADIAALYPRLTRLVKAPLMIDSTDADAIERALLHSQGKAIVNSINLEDGEERFERVCPILRRYGAAVVVGCIDEDPEAGMAVTALRKLDVAERSHRLLTTKYGIPEEDIIFDALVFPCGTGDEAYVGSAGETVEGIRLIKERFPHCSTILGISNVSFGLPEAGRETLNSVFLHDCVEAGLDLAIVNTQGIARYPDIPDDERTLCRDLLYVRRQDALERFTAHYRGRKAKRQATSKPDLPPDERLARYVIEGTKEWLVEDLDALLAAGREPLEIINGPLMAGMAIVGDLFGKNELIVAEVLQSAEVMKAAVSHLEPHMEAASAAVKGKIVLATVKGDVHDIGKNLVEIIFGNNGYEVIDLGIKTPPERLIEACRQHGPDFIGLSGLLVKSAQQMVVCAADLRNAGIQIPLLVGGAALSRSFTDTRIAPEYDGIVAYARDAMDGLSLLDRLRAGTYRPAARPARPTPSTAPHPEVVTEPLQPHGPSQVPSWNRHLCDAQSRDLFGWINPKMLYGKHMGLGGDIDGLLAAGDPRATQLRDLWDELLDLALREDLLRPRGVWQFFEAQADKDDLVIYKEGQEVERFAFPRQKKSPGRCLSDLVHSVESGVMDNVAMFCVTAGHGVRERAKQWKDQGEYLRSHGLQALALETAEAYAEMLHADIRKQWGISDAGLSKKDIFKAKYQGCRYSFGYPACPELSDQEKLFHLIRPADIGVELTDGFMMDPEASVSAIVFSHPEARYFAV